MWIDMCYDLWVNVVIGISFKGAISGRDNLGSLKSLSICVSALGPLDNLAILSVATPALTTLNLDHSRFDSLRYIPIRLMDRRIMVQFAHWFNIWLVLFYSTA